MEKYIILSSSPHGEIRWIPGREVYHVFFNNIILTFNQEAFGNFSDSLGLCYEENTELACVNNCKAIVFNTRLDDIKLYFSVNEIAMLFGMTQQSGLNKMSYEEFGQLSFS